MNADDLGFVPSVTRGIIEAIEHGVVRSASLMVNMPDAADAVRQVGRLMQQGVDVGVGLHLNLVVGRPLTPAPSLTRPDGGFLPLQAHAWRAWRGTMDLVAVERELVAQLDRAHSLLAGVGAPVTHLDSHRHVHAIPAVYQLVTRLARERGIPHVRQPVESTPTLLGRPRAIAARRVLRALVGALPPYDDARFAGVALMRSPTVARDLDALADTLPPGRTELMVHPGYDSAELAAIDGYRAPRERELRALTAPALRERLDRLGISLGRFGATAPPASAPRPGALAGS